MKARTLLCGLALYAIGTTAQTEVNPYIPGATVEGVTYYLPRTALRLVVVAEKQVYTPGDFNKYADRYLRLSNVNPEPYTRWTIKSIEMAPYGVPDMQKAYSIVLKKRTVAPLVGLTRDGILLSINTDSLGEDGKAQYDKLADSIFPSVCRRQYNRGIASFDVKNYDTAVEALAMVVKMDEEYDDGNAMYVLAQAYEATGDTNNAKTYYQKVTEQFSGTEMAEEAQSKLEALNAAADQNAANQNAAADQNGQGAEDSSSQEQDTTE